MRKKILPLGDETLTIVRSAFVIWVRWSKSVELAMYSTECFEVPRLKLVHGQNNYCRIYPSLLRCRAVELV